MAKEKRVFIVDLNLVENDEVRKSIERANKTKDDIELFMDEAEMQGTVYSLEGIQKSFNESALSQENCIMLIADIETSNIEEVAIHEIDDVFVLVNHTGQIVEGGFDTEMEARIFARENGYCIMLIADIETSNIEEVAIHEIDDVFVLVNHTGQIVEDGFDTEREARIFARENGYKIVSWFNF